VLNAIGESLLTQVLKTTLINMDYELPMLQVGAPLIHC
jgi:hypothetical protein